MQATLRRLAVLALVMIAFAACATSAASPSAATPAGPLVTVETLGGECLAGACGQTITIDRDGRVHLAAKPPNDLGTVTPGVLRNLETLIATTDFGAIKSHVVISPFPLTSIGPRLSNSN